MERKRERGGGRGSASTLCQSYGVCVQLDQSESGQRGGDRPKNSGDILDAKLLTNKVLLPQEKIKTRNELNFYIVTRTMFAYDIVPKKGKKICR